MRRIALLLWILALPRMLSAQSLLTIAPQQCVWHAGDDPQGKLGWAANDLDESGWSPYANWKFDRSTPRLWVRCHVDFAPLQTTAHPALQVSVRGAYQLFVDGSLSGAFGDMQGGNFTADYVRTFPLAAPVSSRGKTTIALRIDFRWPPWLSFGKVPRKPEAELIAGDHETLEYRRNSEAFVNGSKTLPTTVAFGIVGIAGVMLLGLFWGDRSRPEFLFFAVFCLALAIRRCIEQMDTSLYPISLFQYELLDRLLVVALLSFGFMAFALARKPVPWFYRVIIGFSCILALAEASLSLVSEAASLRNGWILDWAVVLINCMFGLIFLSPFFAFWPWRQTAASVRYVAATLMIWSVSNEVYIAFLLSRNSRCAWSLRS